MSATKPTLNDLLGITHPIIMAPMFLVSNVAMLKAGMESGIAACVPALNYRTIEELKAAITELKAAKVPGGAFGINLIVNKSNMKYPAQLEAACELGVDFIITSLGSPRMVIEKAKPKGIKVFCDVTDLSYSKKVEAMGCDALVAVNNQAGGHRGNIAPEALIKELNENCAIPVITAGGVANKSDLDRAMSYGAIGASIGSPFIASEEAPVSQEYKQACVDFGAKDIVMTQKISGTPCTVINTPYVQKIGTKQTWLEGLLNKNKKLKKWVKAIRFAKGMRDTTKAAQGATYKTVWVAGPSIEQTTAIEPVATIIKKFI
ncbi:nitronate monooxygenase [uncultured Dokdonia sp.]|jgi:nitronate monooxygenase|uniref:NAD(P)H-dependent flavin oxidoreductase n=1 Tax=uncultured Dokdonia sp. TaxID=575653 RepID=UPI000856F37F|nr:nitronate monooxygenase [uncultured Dokdonia sp.]AOE06041.1 2-nitropropane dioxygenase [uncultured bacterium]